MSEMAIVATEILVAVCLGLLGATLRIFVQYKRDGSLPEEGLPLYAECFLGCGAGFLSWLIVMPEDLRAIAVTALIAGYAGADAVENWLAG